MIKIIFLINKKKMILPSKNTNNNNNPFRIRINIRIRIPFSNNLLSYMDTPKKIKFMFNLINTNHNSNNNSNILNSLLIMIHLIKLD